MHFLFGWMDGWMDGWMLLFVNELIPINPKWSERASRNEILFIRNKKNLLWRTKCMPYLDGWVCCSCCCLDELCLQNPKPWRDTITLLPPVAHCLFAGKAIAGMIEQWVIEHKRRKVRFCVVIVEISIGFLCNFCICMPSSLQASQGCFCCWRKRRKRTRTRTLWWWCTWKKQEDRRYP